MMIPRLILLVVFGVITTPAHAQSRSDAPAIFVGPQIRDGFADMDAGIRDSIRDIQGELRNTSLKLAASREDATIVVIVLARGIATKGSVGSSTSSGVGGTGSGFGSVGPMWSRAARAVVMTSPPGSKRIARLLWFERVQPCSRRRTDGQLCTSGMAPPLLRSTSHGNHTRALCRRSSPQSTQGRAGGWPSDRLSPALTSKAFVAWAAPI
jgi:hypothetical protein